MKVTFEMSAEEYERFAEDSFEGNIGKKIKFGDLKEGVVTKVEVIEDGRAAVITIEI